MVLSLVIYQNEIKIINPCEGFLSVNIYLMIFFSSEELARQLSHSGAKIIIAHSMLISTAKAAAKIHGNIKVRMYTHTQ